MFISSALQYSTEDARLLINGRNYSLINVKLELLVYSYIFTILELCQKNGAFIVTLFPADEVQTRLRANNVFTVARRNLEGQEMLYVSLKLVNDIWVLAEIKMQPGASSITVCAACAMHF